MHNNHSILCFGLPMNVLKLMDEERSILMSLNERLIIKHPSNHVLARKTHASSDRGLKLNQSPMNFPKLLKL